MEFYANSWKWFFIFLLLLERRLELPPFSAYPVIAATGSVIAVLMMLHLLFSQLYLWYRQEKERSGHAPWTPGSKILRCWLSVGAASQNIIWTRIYSILIIAGGLLYISCFIKSE
ncbi:hypothetical protein N510_001466 [Firmicutes bacterium ASF500]|nr:hypothetical protein N510_001466 [Firmicutes bacterium ASF500]